MERIVILGAGFGGLELATRLSEEVPDAVEVVLIDQSDSFVFGYSKLDVMFGRQTEESARPPTATSSSRRCSSARSRSSRSIRRRVAS